MSTLTITLPDSVRRSIESLADENGVPIDDFISCILSQRVAVAEADSYVRRRGLKGSAGQMLEILRAVPSVEPDALDRLPS